MTTHYPDTHPAGFFEKNFTAITNTAAVVGAFASVVPAVVAGAAFNSFFGALYGTAADIAALIAFTSIAYLTSRTHIRYAVPVIAASTLAGLIVALAVSPNDHSHVRIWATKPAMTETATRPDPASAALPLPGTSP